MSNKKETIFDKRVVESSLWLLIPKTVTSIFVSSLLILLIFWLFFGELSYFSFGFAVALGVFQLLTVIGLRFQNRAELHVSKSLQNNWLDKLGAFWLMACAFGALAGWICNQLAAGFDNFKLLFQILSVFSTIVLPILTMIPNLRYLERKVLYIQIPLLFFVTSLPTLVGISPAISLFNRFIN